MNILIVLPSVIPAHKYGGTERVIWYLGKELKGLGHEVTFLVNEGSVCDFAKVLFLDKNKTIEDQIPSRIDLVHFHYVNPEIISKPYIITMHVNDDDLGILDKNTVFISRNHAERFGSKMYVHNGLDWNDYGDPNLAVSINSFHFLGNAAWRVKNLQGAIDTIKQTKNERLNVLGGHRINFKMGFRFTLSPRVSFYGMVGGEEKNNLLRSSKGLVFPVRWHEPFGLAIIESLYFGCPVFGTPYGSLPELVKSEVGFLTDSKSKLAEALQNSDSFSRATCHTYAMEEFNSKKMAMHYAKMYERVLNGECLNNDPPELMSSQNKGLLQFTA